MKTPAPLSLLFFLLFITGCASSQTAVRDSAPGTQTELSQERPDGAVSDDNDYYRDLGDYLRQIPGVNIMGQTVTIRGISSFNSGIEPLFVIDGQVAGTSYSQVNSMISVREIDYVKVLKGSDAAIYGVRGGNGVVLIYLKK